MDRIYCVMDATASESCILAVCPLAGIYICFVAGLAEILSKKAKQVIHTPLTI